NAGTQNRPKMVTSNTVIQRINVLNKRNTNSGIDLEELVDSLSLTQQIKINKLC
ncbi:unnamed protein product, partial [Rotaria sp. Silwood2]